MREFWNIYTHMFIWLNMGYMLIWTKIAEVGYYLCGFFYPRVWVVYTHTRTRIPDGYKNLSNNVPVGAWVSGTRCHLEEEEGGRRRRTPVAPVAVVASG